MHAYTRKNKSSAHKGGNPPITVESLQQQLSEVTSLPKNFGWSTLTKFQQHTKKRTPRMNCNPMVAGSAVDENTCYTKDILIKIRNAYNRTHPIARQITSNHPTKILEIIQKRMKSQCEREDCWLELLPPNQRRFIMKNTFMPFQPKEWERNPREWLSNFDILGVLKQYEMAYPSFKFIGPSPMDFDKRIGKAGCVWNELCRFELSKYLDKGIEHIGISFNLDDHDEEGSHWVSLYIHIPKRLIFYFDSALNDTPPEIDVLVKRIVEQGKAHGIDFHYDSNTIQHQYSNSECGMYSLFFLISLITERWGGKGKKITIEHLLDVFKTRRIPDKKVAEFRKIYFNEPEPK